jgi:NAD(P)-dependent dehydrogenase (short-subunit alcohol dehydrogenase family)
MYFSGEKICLITGANSGIGKAAAKGLARLGATVILVSRNHVRGERTLNELKEKTGNEKFYLFIADLSSQSSILELTHKLKSKFRSIDILINNAGAYFSKRHVTVDGIEATFAVNYLSRFIITNLLLETILNSRQGRIINISSELHRKGKINLGDIEFSNSYSGLKAFSQARLADILFIYELSRRLNGTKVTANCLHPGFVATNIIYNDPDASFLTKLIYKSITPLLRSPEKGAETVIYLASSPEVTNVSGKYFIDKKTVYSSPSTYDKELAQDLWKQSEEMLKVKINSYYEKFFKEIKN